MVSWYSLRSASTPAPFARRTVCSPCTITLYLHFSNSVNRFEQIYPYSYAAYNLPDGAPLNAAFTRMQTDRQEEAATIRAQGEKNAQIIRAEAEADAAATYAAAYGKDPEFYDFYRAMESYRRTFQQGEAESTMILSPDNEYLRQFQGRR